MGEMTEGWQCGRVRFQADMAKAALPRQRTDETASVASRWQAVGREVPE